MKLLFIHDHPFYMDNTEVYSGGGLPARVWKNYDNFFVEIRVIGRHSLNIKDKKVLSSGNPKVSFSLVPNYKSPLEFCSYYSQIKQILSKEINQADIILCRMPSFLSLLASSISRKNKKVIVIEQVGNPKEALSNHSALGRFMAPIIDLWNKYEVSKADFVIYVTNSTLQKVLPFSQESIAISNVILPKKLVWNDVNYQERFQSNQFHLGMIGGFDMKYKGQHILLGAIKELPVDLRKRVLISFVGKGDYSWVLETAKRLDLNQNIKFLGALSAGDEIFKWLRTLSLYVQPSFTEGMPRALLEAMSMGCPVLGSDVGGIPDVIDDYLLHSPKDVIKLSKQIEYVLSSSQLMIDLSNQSLQRVEPFLYEELNRRRKYYFSKIIKYASRKT